MTLEKVKSIDCPKCGCNATTLVDEGARQGNRWARYECDHCNHIFTKGTPSERGSITHYLEKRIPLCPVHEQPMKNNGQSQSGSVYYYICRVRGCQITGKGRNRTVLE